MQYGNAVLKSDEAMLVSGKSVLQNKKFIWKVSRTNIKDSFSCNETTTPKKSHEILPLWHQILQRDTVWASCERLILAGLFFVSKTFKDT